MSLRRNFEELGLSQGAISLISGVDPASGALLANSYDEYAHEEYSMDFINTYRIQDGNINLPLAFYETFHSRNPSGYSNIPGQALGNVIYKLGHGVTGIYQSNDQNKVILNYTNKNENGDTADIFDYVICAIPLSALRTVEIKPYFTNTIMQAILELNYIDAMKALYFCNQRFWERNTEYGNIIGGISFTDLPIQSIIYPGDHNFCSNVSDAAVTPRGSSSANSGLLKDILCSPEEPGVLTASYNLTQNSIRVGEMKDQARYEQIRQNVEEVHGLPKGFLNTFIEQHKTVHWNSEPLHRGAFALYLPGQKPLFAYAMQQPEYHGRIYFAGEHVSNKHGWIQGALYSGKAAANRLAQHFHNQF